MKGFEIKLETFMREKKYINSVIKNLHFLDEKVIYKK